MSVKTRTVQIPDHWHCKRRGEWVEMLFMTQAARRGFTVSKPWGDSSPYDFVIEHRGRFLRIQVKSSAHMNVTPKGTPFGYACFTVRTKTQRSYRGQVDFFAFYIIPEDLWYIIPSRDLKKARTAAYVNPHNPRNRYSRHREAWHLLKKH